MVRKAQESGLDAMGTRANPRDDGLTTARATGGGQAEHFAKEINHRSQRLGRKLSLGEALMSAPPGTKVSLGHK